MTQINGESGLKVVLPASNDLIKENPSHMYPVAWVLATSRCSKVETRIASHSWLDKSLVSPCSFSVCSVDLLVGEEYSPSLSLC